MHILCVAALMWVPIVNGYAFFFDDTTNYIRAADLAAHLASDKQISTAWTERYADKLPTADGEPKSAPTPSRASEEEPQSHTQNDISSGLVMSGRSPYIGALMWLSYVASNFWLFIIFQAALAYFLIDLALQRFDMASRRTVATVVLLLTALTPLPFYNGLLLADVMGAFGILAFILLATPGKLTRFQLLILGGIIVTALVSHLTHIVMMVGMFAMLVLLVWTKLARNVPKRAWIAGIGGIVVGFASLQLTAFATEMALGKKPQLLPLMTARFIADGPGKSFIDSGCDDDKFQICRVELGDTTHALAILATTEPGVGTYMLAEPEERRKMGEEDIAFALAVFFHDPVAQTGAIISNTFSQLTRVEYTGLNRNCSGSPVCWDAIPASVGEDMKTALADREAWPEELMDLVLKITVVLSLVVLAFCLIRARNLTDERWTMLLNWSLLTFAAMMMMSVFGGAVVQPQWRYISRLIWLVPLFAMIAAVLYRRTTRSSSTVKVEDRPSPA